MKNFTLVCIAGLLISLNAFADEAALRKKIGKRAADAIMQMAPGETSRFEFFLGARGDSKAERREAVETFQVLIQTLPGFVSSDVKVFSAVYAVSVEMDLEAVLAAADLSEVSSMLSDFGPQIQLIE